MPVVIHRDSSGAPTDGGAARRTSDRLVIGLIAGVVVVLTLIVFMVMTRGGTPAATPPGAVGASSAPQGAILGPTIYAAPAAAQTGMQGGFSAPASPAATAGGPTAVQGAAPAPMGWRSRPVPPAPAAVAGAAVPRAAVSAAQQGIPTTGNTGGVVMPRGSIGPHGVNPPGGPFGAGMEETETEK